MKLFYAIVLVLMVFVSACAQQAAEPKAEPTEQAAEPAEPEIAPEPETGAAVAVPEEEAAAPAAGNEVRMLGVGQYDPEEVTISAGSSITFSNEGNKKTVVTIKGPSGVANSPLIAAGEKYEHEFAEAGEYDAWAVVYGLGVKVIVK